MRRYSLLASLFVTSLAFAPFHTVHAQIGIGIGFNISTAPPELPVYEQPPMPDDGYIWTPGYWAYGDDGYYWVPGTWIEPPAVGMLWTPGYWGWRDGLYIFNGGDWNYCADGTSPAHSRRGRSGARAGQRGRSAGGGLANRQARGCPRARP